MTTKSDRKVFVKPSVPNLVVRDPDRRGEQLARDGEWKPRNRYWLRRLADGSVIEAAPPKERTKTEA